MRASRPPLNVVGLRPPHMRLRRRPGACAPRSLPAPYDHQEMVGQGMAHNTHYVDGSD